MRRHEWENGMRQKEKKLHQGQRVSVTLRGREERSQLCQAASNGTDRWIVALSRSNDHPPGSVSSLRLLYVKRGNTPPECQTFTIALFCC